MVEIPFAEEIEWKDPSNRRNQQMFLDMIKGYAALRFKRRETVNGHLVASLDDYDDARELYCSRAENMQTKLNGLEIKICKTINDHTLNNGFCTSPDIEKKTGLTQGAVHHIIHGRNDRPGSGLLNKVHGLTYENESFRDEDVEFKTK